MNTIKHLGTYLLLCGLIAALEPFQASAQSKPDAARTDLQQTLRERDGQHDFDFEIGAWKTDLKRLLHPLTGSSTWVEYHGTSVVRKIWNGHANLVELEVDGPAGHIEGLNLRLYNPQSHQWSLNFASSNGGALSHPRSANSKMDEGSSSTRKHSMAEPSLFALLFLTLLRIRAVLNSRSLMMGAKPGR